MNPLLWFVWVAQVVLIYKWAVSKQPLLLLLERKGLLQSFRGITMIKRRKLPRDKSKVNKRKEGKFSEVKMSAARREWS